MGIAILLVYLMMVLAFNSLVTPFIILFSLPLATIGAFPALLITGRPIGLQRADRVPDADRDRRDERDRAARPRRAAPRGGLLDARGADRGRPHRLRPILMTAIATILALVPLAAGFNEGSIIAAELGTVVIGGLISSTILTLLVIPAIYSLVDGLKVRVSRIGRRSTTLEPAAEPST